jgi:hypothetical protein
MTDRESAVSVLKENERNYVMLEELSVRPRTSYLGKLRNPNPGIGGLQGVNRISYKD